MFVTICLHDEVFQDLVDEALGWAISRLSNTKVTLEAYQALLPHVCHDFSLSTALELLHQLQRYHRDPEWYLLQPPHRVALSDVLHRYCERYKGTAARLSAVCQIWIARCGVGADATALYRRTVSGWFHHGSHGFRFHGAGASG
jgi:hypothetical protein